MNFTHLSISRYQGSIIISKKFNFDFDQIWIWYKFVWYLDKMAQFQYGNSLVLPPILKQVLKNSLLITIKYP